MRKIINGIFNENQNRIFGLDLLRAFAIFCTVYGHAVLLVPEKFRSYHNVLVSAIDGVAIFFVLSGYLIGGILLKSIYNKEATFKISIFWMRRWMRTLPAYFFILILLIVIFALKGELDNQFFYYFLFGQNLFHVKSGFFAESWSLAIEEWFYLLFPVCISIILFLGIKLKKSVKITIILFFIIPV